ncbi:MAG: hypothetical protein JNL45_12510 [Hyphomicrobium sp.]|nr:hypothetical protein [Hyphomicrobium sp.]
MLGRPDDDDDAHYYSELSSQYQTWRDEKTLSANPGRELFASCTLVVLAVAGLFCVAVRLPNISFHAFWFVSTFLVTLIYYLRDASSAMYTIDLFVVRFYKWLGLAPAIRQAHLTKFKIAEAAFNLVVVGALFFCSLYPTFLAMDAALTWAGYPPPAQPTPYTGGG